MKKNLIVLVTIVVVLILYIGIINRICLPIITIITSRLPPYSTVKTSEDTKEIEESSNKTMSNFSSTTASKPEIKIEDFGISNDENFHYIKAVDTTFKAKQWLITADLRALFASYAANAVKQVTSSNPLDNIIKKIYVAEFEHGNGIAVLFFTPYRWDLYLQLDYADFAMCGGVNVIDGGDVEKLAQSVLSGFNIIGDYYLVSENEIANAQKTVNLIEKPITPTARPTEKPYSYSSSYSSFTNKYGTPNTKCYIRGCSNTIASSGDTNCCTIHSKRCMNCGCYIDNDAMFCMSCLEKAIKKK